MQTPDTNKNRNRMILTIFIRYYPDLLSFNYYKLFNFLEIQNMLI